MLPVSLQSVRSLSFIAVNIATAAASALTKS